MKLDAHIPLTGRRISTLGLAALASCFMLVGTSEAVAKATTSKSSTQAQKLSKALKACKKQPKSKRAACAKRARKRYLTHHAVTPLSVTTPTGSTTTPTSPATTPTAPVTPPAAPVTPPSGSVAPPGPTQAWLQQELETVNKIGTNPQVLNLNILQRGTPHLGSGRTIQEGFDEVLSTTWVFPLEYSYELTYKVATGFNPETAEFEYYLETEHLQTQAQAQFNQLGEWILRNLTGGGAHSCTSEPVEVCKATWRP